MATAPELKFQKHIADFLVRVHRYGVLDQADITDTEHSIAEDVLWSFLGATQADALKKLVADYGTDARDEVFKALRSELAHTPLWLLLRNGLKVRGQELRSRKLLAVTRSLHSSTAVLMPTAPASTKRVM